MIKQLYNSGAYKYKDSFFSSRADLIEAIMSDKLSVAPYHYWFNDDIFGSIDWTFEPDISLEKLYEMRARQIRDEYDYIILSFSGGSDSNEILETFLEHDLFIDEIQTVHYSKIINRLVKHSLINDRSLSIFLEYEKAVIPKLKKIRNVSPQTKITEYDVSDYMYDQIVNSKFDYMGIKDKVPNSPGLFKKFRINTFFMHHNNNNFFESKGKKVAFVRGYDKPVLSIEEGSLYFRFTDMPMHGVNLIRADNIEEKYIFEDFFWSPKCPLIPIKQSHVIKKFMIRNPKLYDCIQSLNDSFRTYQNLDASIDIHSYNKETKKKISLEIERLYSKLIYKHYANISFIAPKPLLNPETEVIKLINETHFVDDVFRERFDYFSKRYKSINDKALFKGNITSQRYWLGKLKG